MSTVDAVTPSKDAVKPDSCPTCAEKARTARAVNQPKAPSDPRDLRLPTEPTVYRCGTFPVGETFEDERGTITNILHHQIGSVVGIQSKRGTLRANHIHKTDFHYCLVVDGTVEYYERPMGAERTTPTRLLYGPGDMFFTGPGIEHTMYFPVETTFLCFGRNNRDHDSHEEDLTRFSKDLRTVWAEMTGLAP